MVAPAVGWAKDAVAGERRVVCEGLRAREADCVDGVAPFEGWEVGVGVGGGGWLLALILGRCGAVWGSGSGGFGGAQFSKNDRFNDRNDGAAPKFQNRGKDKFQFEVGSDGMDKDWRSARKNVDVPIGGGMNQLVTTYSMCMGGGGLLSSLNYSKLVVLYLKLYTNIAL